MPIQNDPNINSNHCQINLQSNENQEAPNVPITQYIVDTDDA